MSQNHNQTGQVLLLILLAMAVVSTLVLSVVSRSITDISVTTQDEQSLRAFSAAEAGVEKAVVDGLAIGSASSGDVGAAVEAQFNSQVTEFPRNRRQFVYPTELVSADTATVWFVGHNEDNSLNTSEGFTGRSLALCWGRPGETETPAIEVSVFYEDAGDIRIARSAFDPNPKRRSDNNFGAPDSSVLGSHTEEDEDDEDDEDDEEDEDDEDDEGEDTKTTPTPSPAVGTCDFSERDFSHLVNLDMVDDFAISSNVWSSVGRLKMARIRMLFNPTEPHALGVVSTGSSSDFPVQGRLVESTGTSGTAQRKIELINLFPEPPSVFDAAIFSEINLNKQ